MDNPQSERLHILVHGIVQGVGFRYYVLGAASAMHLSGWVRNTSTGQVEAVAEGPRSVLDHFASYLEEGPENAFVSHVEKYWLPATGEFSGFNITSTR